jgi:mono/diheme cytochrome c family protein
MRKLHFTSTYLLAATVAVATLVSSCTKSPDSPGYEYFPDMYRSPAVEAYVDYDVDSDPFSDRNSKMSARHNVEGTIAFSADAAKAWVNYPYPFSKDQYDEASAYFEEGKTLFTKMCQHCHGSAGAGDGMIVQNGNYPPIPAYKGISGLNLGKMFHTLTYGKGNMGSHASQLNKEERWTVIHYVTALQKEAADYDAYAAMTAATPVLVDSAGTMAAMPPPADAQAGQ